MDFCFFGLHLSLSQGHGLLHVFDILSHHRYKAGAIFEVFSVPLQHSLGLSVVQL